MAKALVLLAALLLPTHATAQQIRQNTEKCLDITARQSEYTFRNTCDYALGIEALHADTGRLSEYELNPGKEVTLPHNVFGAACPAGYRSETPITPENRKQFTDGTYRCARR